VPKDATSLKITAFYKDDEGDQVSVDQQAVAFYSLGDFFVHVSTSTDEGLLGHFATIHLRSNFAFQDYIQLRRTLYIIQFLFNSKLLDFF